MLRAGRIGGDLGGFYTIHYETAPFEANGRQVRLRMTTRLVSPVNHRVESRISVDGGRSPTSATPGGARACGPDGAEVTKREEAVR